MLKDIKPLEVAIRESDEIENGTTKKCKLCGTEYKYKSGNRYVSQRGLQSSLCGTCLKQMINDIRFNHITIRDAAIKFQLSPSVIWELYNRYSPSRIIDRIYDDVGDMSKAKQIFADAKSA